MTRFRWDYDDYWYYDDVSMYDPVEDHDNFPMFLKICYKNKCTIYRIEGYIDAIEVLGSIAKWIAKSLSRRHLKKIGRVIDVIASVLIDAISSGEECEYEFRDLPISIEVMMSYSDVEDDKVDAVYDHSTAIDDGTISLLNIEIDNIAKKMKPKEFAKETARHSGTKVLLP